MSERKLPQPMTPDEFFAWQAEQEVNYELVDGFPVPARAMTGATRRQDRVIVNALRRLADQLDGSRCFPSTADISVRNANGNVRRPDITVDCQSDSDSSTEAVEPRVVIEVLSPSTTRFDRFRKVEEYKGNPAVAVVLLLDTESPSALCWRREGKAWTLDSVDGLDATIALPEIGTALAMRDLYRGLRFEARPD